MRLSRLETDAAVLEELGRRLARQRIDARLTQAELAERAGVGKRTLERIEAGASAQVTSLVRILRELALLDVLDDLLPETGPRPMDRLRHGDRRPRRVSKRGHADKSGEWSWGDEA